MPHGMELPAVIIPITVGHLTELRKCKALFLNVIELVDTLLACYKLGDRGLNTEVIDAIVGLAWLPILGRNHLCHTVKDVFGQGLARLILLYSTCPR